MTLEVETTTDDLPKSAMEMFQLRTPETMHAPDYERDHTVVVETY